jgi:hypothetical protein
VGKQWILRESHIVNKAMPMRIIVEDPATFTLYTWMKYKSYEGPFFYHKSDLTKTMCGDGTAAGMKN